MPKKITLTELEKHILAELKTGEEKAFEYIFTSYYQQLYNYAFEILKESYSAEEVVEETFIKIWENRRLINVEKSIKSYLYKSVYNLCLNIFKHNNVINKYEVYLKHHVALPELLLKTENEHPLANLIESELAQTIDKTIENLPEQSKIIFRMSRNEYLSNDEIATKLNISVNTVKTHISRSLKKLREQLEDYLH